jgi:hypothetical protein
MNQSKLRFLRYEPINIMLFTVWTHQYYVVYRQSKLDGQYCKQRKFDGQYCKQRKINGQYCKQRMFDVQYCELDSLIVTC